MSTHNCSITTASPGTCSYIGSVASYLDSHTLLHLTLIAKQRHLSFPRLYIPSLGGVGPVPTTSQPDDRNTEVTFRPRRAVAPTVT